MINQSCISTLVKTIFIVGILATLLIIRTTNAIVKFERGKVVDGSLPRRYLRQAKPVEHLVEALDHRLCGIFNWLPNKPRKRRSSTQDVIPTHDDHSNDTQNLLSAHKRMTNGLVAMKKQFPSYVKLEAVNLNDFENKREYMIQSCGGTLVAQDMVLTAAHCLSPLNKITSMIVRAGFVDKREQIVPIRGMIGYTDEVQIANVYGFCMHEKYDRVGGEETVVGHDMAVLQLDRKFSFNEYVQPACIQFHDAPSPTETLYAVGMGLMNETDLSKQLNYMTMKRASDRGYSGPTNTLYRSSGLVATLCSGDSGSGLYMVRDERQFLAGILSSSTISEEIRNGLRYTKPCDRKYHGKADYVDVFKEQKEIRKLLKFCYEKI